MSLFLFNPASQVAASSNQDTASLLFTGKNKKKKKVTPQQQATSQGNAAVTTPTGVSNLTSATAALDLSQAVADSFQKTLPSLAPIHSFLKRIEASSDFQNADGPNKQRAETLLQKAKAMTQDLKASRKERLTVLNDYAVQLFHKKTSWQDLMQFLKIMNVPVLESNQHAWVQRLLDRQGVTAMFARPATLYGFAPSWSTPSASSASAKLFPEFAELSEKMEKENTVRILATTNPAQALKTSHGENVSLNFLKHETCHFLQLIMGIPLQGPSEEADYRAQQVQNNFLQSLQNPEQRINQTTRLMHEAFGKILQLLDGYHAASADIASLQLAKYKLSGRTADLKTSHVKSKALANLDSKIEQRSTERSELDKQLEEITKTKRGKAYKEAYIDPENRGEALSDEIKIQRMMLLRKELLEKKKSKKEDSPTDRSVGAAIRRIVNKEQEVYSVMINNKDAMGIDPKFHLYNLEAWVTYEQLERESHKYDQEAYKL